MAGCRTNLPWSPQILFGNTHRQTHTLSSPSTTGMCTSDFAALCWVMPRPVPKIAALLLIMPACPLAIGWSFGQPGLRHNDETTSRLCLRSNAILTFLQDENARGHCDVTVTMLSVEGVCVTVWLSVRVCICVCVCVSEFIVWRTGSEWLGADVTFTPGIFLD